MKKIFLTALCTLLSLSPFLHSPQGENSQDDTAFFAHYMHQLIHSVKAKKESKKYSDRDMNTFLLVAVALKNGQPDETYKDIHLALSLFEIVKETSTNQTLRKNADNGIKDIQAYLSRPQ